MKKFILPAIILAVISFIPLLFLDPVTGMTPSYLNWSYILLSFIIFLLAVRRFKLVYSNGVLSFSEAFKYGLKLSLCYAIIGSVFYLVYAKFNENSMLKAMGNAMKIAEEKQIETQGSVSPSYQKLMETMVTIMSNPYVMSGIKLLNFLFWGLLFSLVSSAIVKNKTENQETF